MAARQTKPKCTNSTACGYSCIESSDTCSSTVKADIATALVEFATKRELGRGWFGVVVETDRGTAVKTFKNLSKAGFAAELAGAKLLSETKTGPKLLAYDEDKRLIETELVAGKTLREIAKDQPQRLAEAKELVLKPLFQLHKAGYAHADLSDDNVLVDFSTSQAKLIDAAFANQIGKRKKVGGYSALSQAGYFEAMKVAGSTATMQLIDAELKSNGALAAYKELVDSTAKLPDSKADRIRAKAEQALHTAYLEAVARTLI